MRPKKSPFPQRGWLQASVGEKEGHEAGFVVKGHEAQQDGDSSYLRVLCAFVIREHGCKGEKGAGCQGKNPGTASLRAAPARRNSFQGWGGSEGEPGERGPCSPTFACCHEVRFRTTAGSLEMVFSPVFTSVHAESTCREWLLTISFDAVLAFLEKKGQKGCVSGGGGGWWLNPVVCSDPKRCHGTARPQLPSEIQF